VLGPVEFSPCVSNQSLIHDEIQAPHCAGSSFHPELCRLSIQNENCEDSLNISTFITPLLSLDMLSEHGSSIILFLQNQGTSLAERVQQLTEMAMKKSVLKFNGSKFKQYIKSPPRNYSGVVMFTAMAPQRQCQICR